MDKKKDSKITQYGTAADLPDEKVVVGAKQLRKAVLSGQVKAAFLAEDADPAVTGPLETLCVEHHIQITRVPSMAALGKRCGIEVGAAAAAVLKNP